MPLQRPSSEKISATMTSTRRIGAEDSATRLALLDAAQQLILDEGYAAVTSRKVAAKAGLKPQLVHYYFRTMDDLFVAMVRRGAEQNLDRQAEALAANNPLRALWKLMTDPAGATLTMEFSALANHRKAIGVELARYADQFRALQAEAFTTILATSEGSGGDLAPEAAAFLLTAISQILAMETSIGLDRGHAEISALVERYIVGVEPQSRTKG